MQDIIAKADQSRSLELQLMIQPALISVLPVSIVSKEQLHHRVVLRVPIRRIQVWNLKMNAPLAQKVLFAIRLE